MIEFLSVRLGGGDSDTPYGGKGHRIAQRTPPIITINPSRAFKRNAQYICGRAAGGAAGGAEAAAPSDSVPQTTCLSEEQTRRHVAEHARGFLSHPAVKRGKVGGGGYIIQTPAPPHPPPPPTSLTPLTKPLISRKGLAVMPCV